MAQQPPHVLGVLGIHPAQEQLGVGRRHRPQQVGGVVGIHRLEHVGRALRLQLPQHVGLLVFRQLLQHVGEPLVVERPDHLEAAFVRQFADRLGDLDRPLALELLEQLRHALAGHRQSRRGQALHVLPVDDVDVSAAAEPARKRPHRDPGDHPVAGPGLLDAQVDDDDVDLGELGQSGSSTRTRVSITWPSTSTSPGRCENFRSDTLAVVRVTALGSMAVTRPIGTKMRRRVSSSTTSPSTLG